MAADLKLGGFNGTWGKGAAIERKRAKLQKEGVKFAGVDEARISETCVHAFADEQQPVQKKRKR